MLFFLIVTIIFIIIIVVGAIFNRICQRNQPDETIRKRFNEKTKVLRFWYLVGIFVTAPFIFLSIFVESVKNWFEPFFEMTLIVCGVSFLCLLFTTIIFTFLNSDFAKNIICIKKSEKQEKIEFVLDAIFGSIFIFSFLIVFNSFCFDMLMFC